MAWNKSTGWKVFALIFVVWIIAAIVILSEFFDFELDKAFWIGLVIIILGGLAAALPRAFEDALGSSWFGGIKHTIVFLAAAMAAGSFAIGGSILFRAVTTTSGSQLSKAAADCVIDKITTIQTENAVEALEKACMTKYPSQE